MRYFTNTYSWKTPSEVLIPEILGEVELSDFIFNITYFLSFSSQFLGAYLVGHNEMMHIRLFTECGHGKHIV